MASRGGVGEAYRMPDDEKAILPRQTENYQLNMLVLCKLNYRCECYLDAGIPAAWNRSIMLGLHSPLLGRLTASAVLGAGLLLPLNAIAQVWVEVGNAGDLPATAQPIVGVTPLTGISGALTAGDKDMFLVHSNGGAFAAEVTAAGGDTQLFLFSSNGLGLLANDDNGVLFSQPRISGTLAAGDYFLAISEFNNDPTNALGLIFPDDFLLLVGPTGPGGASPITSWSGSTGNAFDYAIALTGLTSVTSIPPGQATPDESSTLVLFSLGVFGLLIARRRLKG